MVRAALSLGRTTCALIFGCSPALSTKAADAAFAAPFACVPLVAAHLGTATGALPAVARSRSGVAPGGPVPAPGAGAVAGVTPTGRGGPGGTDPARNEAAGKKLFGGLFFF